MDDRQVQYPRRIKLTPVSGQANTYDYDLIEGDIIKPGTPLNKANLLTDATATLLGLGANPTVNDALGKIATKAEMTTGTYTGNGATTRTIALGFTPKYVFIFGFVISTASLLLCQKLEGKSIVDRGAGYATENTTHTITTNGFLVGTNDKQSDDSNNNTNRSGRIYYYVAIG